MVEQLLKKASKALVDAEATAQAAKDARAAAVAKQARYHWSSSEELAKLASEAQAAEDKVAAAKASLAAQLDIKTNDVRASCCRLDVEC